MKPIAFSQAIIRSASGKDRVCQSLVSLLRSWPQPCARRRHLRGLEGMGTPRAATSSAGSRPAGPLAGQVRLVGVPARRRPRRRAAGGRSHRGPGRLEAGHPLVLLRRQPALLPHQRRRGAGGCSRPRRRPSATPRHGSAGPAPGRPRPGAPAAPLRASAGVERPPRPAGPCVQVRAGQPLRQVGQRREPASSSSSSSPASSAAGTPSSARAPAVVSPSWIPAWWPSWWIAAGAACRPETVDQRAAARRVVGPADLERLAERQHERQAGRRQPAVHAGRAQVDVVRHQRGDVRAAGAPGRRHTATVADLRHARQGAPPAEGLRLSSSELGAVQQHAQLVEGQLAQLAGLELAELHRADAGCG